MVDFEQVNDTEAMTSDTEAMTRRCSVEKLFW